MAKIKIVYAVGEFLGAPYHWGLLGIFDKEEDAVAACTKPNHFVGPLEANIRLPDEQEYWPDLYYPLSGDTMTGPFTA